LDAIDDASVMEQYGDEVGLAALERPDVLDANYRRSTWMSSEEWFADMTSSIFNKMASQ